jgi:para-aminobenzoate synthetase
MHGRLSAVAHSGHALFAGIPSGATYSVRSRGSCCAQAAERLTFALQVVRYHSLVVDEATLPPCLQRTAWVDGDAASGGGVLMGLSHVTQPHHGVQFHPESIATTFGDTLLRNFRTLTESHWLAAGRGANRAPRWEPRRSAPCTRQLMPAPPPAAVDAGAATVRVLCRRLPGGAAVGSDALFWGLFAPIEAAELDTWWLDSATTADGRARFSFMVSPALQLFCHVLTALALRRAAVAVRGGSARLSGWMRRGARRALTGPPAPQSPWTPLGRRGRSAQVRLRSSALLLMASYSRTPELFTLLEERLASARSASSVEGVAALPFDFWGGWVGYLGCGCSRAAGAAHTS